MLRHFLSSTIAICTTIVVCADPAQEKESAPFAVPSDDSTKRNEGELVTATVLKVTPVEGWNPQLVPRELWPDVAAPTNFNRSFEAPSAVWRIAGGFLASFDAGEFGGALFFSAHGAKKWTKIVDAYVSHLERFEGDCYLAVGGMAHLTTAEGSALLITRDKNGNWKSMVAFETQIGVPRIIGTTMTEAFLKAKADKLIVIAIDSHWGWDPLFGITAQGTVHYLGERPRKDPSKQNANGKPDTSPEAKSQRIDKPQTKPE